MRYSSPSRPTVRTSRIWTSTTRQVAPGSATSIAIHVSGSEAHRLGPAAATPGAKLPISMDDGAEMKEEHPNAERPQSHGVQEPAVPEAPQEDADEIKMDDIGNTDQNRQPLAAEGENDTSAPRPWRATRHCEGVGARWPAGPSCES